jgi:hypothetical protein
MPIQIIKEAKKSQAVKINSDIKAKNHSDSPTRINKESNAKNINSESSSVTNSDDLSIYDNYFFASKIVRSNDDQIKKKNNTSTVNNNDKNIENLSAYVSIQIYNLI